LNLEHDDLPLSKVVELIVENPKILRRPILTDGKQIVGIPTRTSEFLLPQKKIIPCYLVSKIEISCRKWWEILILRENIHKYKI
jgi:hypothetical protein